MGASRKGFIKMTDNEKLFLSSSKNKRIIVFGAGQNGKEFVIKYKDSTNISYIIDNNAELWGHKINGVIIESPLRLKQDLENNSDIFVLIAIGRYFSVYLQLLSQIGFKAQFSYINGQFIKLSEFLINEKLDGRFLSNILLRIETTNRCNFNCSFCTHGKLKRQLGDIDNNLYRKIIVEASKLGIKKLDLRNFGEPLLDKKLEERVFFAKKYRFINTFIYTNALLLTKERYISLSNSGLDNIIVSISPKREFDLTRRGISYGQIFNNIAQCIKEYKQGELLNLYRSAIEVHIIASNSTKEECMETEDMLREIGIENILQAHIHNWANTTDGISLKNQNPCHRLFDSITILRDGKVALCCIDYDGEYIMGDLNKGSLADVINSNIYCGMRKIHLKGIFPKICQKCTNFR